LAYSAYGPVGGCTPKIGYVKLNEAVVWQGSWCGSFSNHRGVNVLLVDPSNCLVLESHRFDTYASGARATELSSYLRSLNYGSVVVAVTADEPTQRLTNALSTLREIGVELADVRYRGSFAFIIQKGYPTKTALSKALTEEESHASPARVNAVITGLLSDARAICNITLHCLHIITPCFILWGSLSISAITFPNVGGF